MTGAPDHTPNPKPVADHSHQWKGSGWKHFTMYETPVEERTSTGWGAAPSNDGHTHDDYQFPDIVHNHGEGWHHHHLTVHDAPTFYWSPAWHWQELLGQHIKKA
jgi:hypothetical protein